MVTKSFSIFVLFVFFAFVFYFSSFFFVSKAPVMKLVWVQ